MYELISVVYTKGKSIDMAISPDEMENVVYDNRYSLESIMRYAEVFEYTVYVGDDSVLLLGFERLDIKLRIFTKIKE